MDGPVTFPNLKYSVLVLVAALVGLAACAPVNTAYRAPIDHDVTERAKVGLPFDVQDFTWTYVQGGSRLKVSGTIKNNGRAARRGVIYALMFDEKGLGVAMGESSISPVCRPGARALST